MKRWITLGMLVCLLLCGCQDPVPVQTEPPTTAAATAAPTTPLETQPTQAPTVPETEAPTAPVELVTIYIVDKTVAADVSQTQYFYDENYNIVSSQVHSIENELLYTTYFEEQDENGMFGQSREVWEGSEYIHTFTWFQDGKIREELYTPGYSGFRYEYDMWGNVTEREEYYDDYPQPCLYYQYEEAVLTGAYCMDEEGRLYYECWAENGRLTGKQCYYEDGSKACAHEFTYDENGNLYQEFWTDEYATSLDQTHYYRAVEVDARRVPYIMEQQKHLLSVT